MESKTYILKKDCPNIGKETGDYYNGEYGDSLEKIAELVAKGVIEEETKEPRTPREAKQQLLDDLIKTGRSIVINPEATVNEVLLLNQNVLEVVAERHGLIIPPRQ